MGDNDELVRHGGSNFAGPAHASPYPVSRLSPAHDLVDMAREIAEADNMIGTVTHAKLELIAEQIRALQTKAREVLAAAADNAGLHRAACSFQRRIGQTYHLYRRPDGRDYFSMLGPEDWNGAPPHAFGGSFRLEPDMSWSPAERSRRARIGELRLAIGVGESPGSADSG